MSAHEVGRIAGAAPGPTLVVVGGMHGNEPAGVEVARRVLEDARLVAGEVVGLRANVAALAAGKRYLERDLNRQWTAARVAAARAAGPVDAESEAVIALADEFDAIQARARGPVFTLDLHTMSAEGAPFIIVGASEPERAFAASIPLPAIAGMHERLEGVLAQYLVPRGCLTLAVEGGQHTSPRAVTILEAVVRVALAAAGLIAPDDAADARELLTRARGPLPHLVEVVLRHEVLPDSGFRMEPGFTNLQRTRAGTLLAREHGGEIRAPFDGLVLLPLYQAQGSDGFFYGREVE